MSDDLLSLVIYDNMDAVEAVINQKGSHFYSVNKFVDLVKEHITDDIKYIRFYFDKVHTNTKFDQDSKSIYVLVLIYCLLTDKSAKIVDWEQLHETVPGFKYPPLSRPNGAIDGKLNKLLTDISVPIPLNTY